MEPTKLKNIHGGGGGACPSPYPYEEEYLNLLANAVAVEAGGEPIPAKDKRRLMSLLLNDNEAGYEPITGKWYAISGASSKLDDYGEPTRFSLSTANGRRFTRPAAWHAGEEGAFRFLGLPFAGLSFRRIIEDSCAWLRLCDDVARQNMEAVKTPYIVTCKNPDTRLSIMQAIEQKQAGQAVLIVSDDLGDAVKGLSIEVPYLADKAEDFKHDKRAELLTKLGVLTANTAKKERVQSAEVNSRLGEAEDYIYLLIDNFNRQAEDYGLPFKMSSNTAMEELYLDDEESEDVDDIEEDAQAGAQNDD